MDPFNAFGCGELKHIKFNCPNRKKANKEKEEDKKEFKNFKKEREELRADTNSRTLRSLCR